MEFRTEYNKGEQEFVTPAGTQTIGIFQEQYDKNGKMYLKKVGERNVYNEIQASAKETEIYTILDRYTKTGDPELLNRRQTFYGDFRNVPSTPIEYQNMIMKAEKDFYSIDKDIRAEFNNDVGEFKAAVLKGTFEEKMSKFIKKEEAKETANNVIKPEGVNLNE